MATTTTTATIELVRVDEPPGVAERAAIAGFLAGYTGNISGVARALRGGDAKRESTRSGSRGERR